MKIDGRYYAAFNKNNWFGDTGTSCSMINYDNMIYDVVLINDPVQGYSGVCNAVKKGKMDAQVCQTNGVMKKVPLNSIKFCPNALINLLSLTLVVYKGGNLETDDNKNIQLIFDHSDITLDFCIKTKDGWVSGVEIFTISTEFNVTFFVIPLVCRTRASIFPFLTALCTPE